MVPHWSPRRSIPDPRRNPRPVPPVSTEEKRGQIGPIAPYPSGAETREGWEPPGIVPIWGAEQFWPQIQPAAPFGGKKGLSPLE